MNGNQRIKEFFNLNGYYLRLTLTNDLLSLTSYNSDILDGIKYESIMTQEIIKKNDRLKNLTILALYELIVNKIKEKKVMLKSSPNSINLFLLDNFSLNPNKDIQISLIRNNKYYSTEYESLLSNVIIGLKEENKNMRNEIIEIKNMFKLGNNGNISNNISTNNISNSRMPNPSVNILKKSLTTSPQNPNIILNASQNPKIIDKTKSINMQSQLKKSMQIPEQTKNSLLNMGAVPMNNNTPKQNVGLGANNIQDNGITNKNIINNKNVANLNINELANLNYPNYPQVELSQNSVGRISAYAVNSYHGIYKTNNEDKTKVIADYKLNKQIKDMNGNIINYIISYFAIYDGHGGSKCSDFLNEKFDSFLFNSSYFPLMPLQAINEAFLKSEKEFESIAFDSQKNVMLDKSGSCALSITMINDLCLVSYLGDSRGLYSFDSGNQLFQITRDHKPNDIIERTRIEKAGGKIFKDTRLKINGQKIHVNEQSLPGFNFPFRVTPGNLAVSQKKFIINNKYYIGSKNNWRYGLKKSFGRRNDWNCYR